MFIKWSLIGSMSVVPSSPKEMGFVGGFYVTFIAAVWAPALSYPPAPANRGNVSLNAFNPIWWSSGHTLDFKLNHEVEFNFNNMKIILVYEAVSE